VLDIGTVPRIMTGRSLLAEEAPKRLIRALKSLLMGQGARVYQVRCSFVMSKEANTGRSSTRVYEVSSRTVAEDWRRLIAAVREEVDATENDRAWIPSGKFYFHHKIRRFKDALELELPEAVELQARIDGV
jgi:hypothetical protein